MSKQQQVQVQVQAQPQTRIEKRPTAFHHVFLIDWDDNGIFKEVVVLKEFEDGTIRGIEVERLHPIDKSRIKKIVTSQHADKYELWELMSQITMKNGYNALDFFTVNYMKEKRPRGAIVGGSLMDAPNNPGNDMTFTSGYDGTASVSGSQKLDL